GLDFLDAAVVEIRHAVVVAAIDARVIELCGQFVPRFPRVAEVAGDVALIVAVAVGVVDEGAGVGGIEAAALAITQVERVAPAGVAAAQAGVVAAGAAAAEADFGGDGQGAFGALARDDLHHTADRVGAIQAAGGAAQDF